MDADSTNGTEAVYPDGLTAEIVETLLCEARTFWATAVPATSALVDGSAAQRRERRMARREMGAVVRALPAHFASTSADVLADEVA